MEGTGSIMKSAAIIGVNGQDGAWLSEHLLNNDYEVYGVSRRGSTDKMWRLRFLDVLSNSRFHSVSGDITDSSFMSRFIAENQFDEVYNVAAQSHVGESFKVPVATCEINFMGVLHILEAIRTYSPKTRFYQASTSEMLGRANWNEEFLMDEETSFYPRSPYGVAKVASHYMVQNYREAYNLFGCCGILFNHEGELRQETFVTSKICKGAVDIYLGNEDKLGLGNLEAKRDWGHAKDYVKAMHLMLQQDEPEDFVIGTGETRTVREFCKVAFGYLGLDYSKYVYEDPDFYRPADVGCLIANNAKAQQKLGWKPEIGFEMLVSQMCSFWLDKLSKRSVR